MAGVCQPIAPGADPAAGRLASVTRPPSPLASRARTLAAILPSDVGGAGVGLLVVAAVAAGLVNAVAGGGTLISFPALVAVGLPAVTANVTNTVALCPGYFGGALAQRDALRARVTLVRQLVPVGIVGGLTGGVLLLVTSESVFETLIPFLIFAACALLAAQTRINRYVTARHGGRGVPKPVLFGTVFVASTYGGYFGAGLGIILLAALGVLLDDDLRVINALKQVLALVVNTTAAVFFAVSGRVAWWAAAIMAVGALIGGNLGGRLVGRLSPQLLRAIVVVIGVSVGIVYLVK
jgi:uncharacterized membrane protein YfcA